MTDEENMRETEEQSIPVFDDIETLFGEKVKSESKSNHEESKQLYFDMIEDFRSTCEKLKEQDSVECTSLASKIEQCIKFLKEDERMLMGLANTPYSYVLQNISGENIYSYIVIHGVNVTIYAMKIFIDLGVPDNRLPYLGLTSLFSRLGLLDAPPEVLAEYPETSEAASDINKYEKFSKKYINKIVIENYHTASIESILSMVKEDRQNLSKTSLNEAMHQYAMVIHICDEFEKLTHQRTYGEVFAPIDAMKKMRNEMKDHFNQDIIKFFFNKLSIYPLGSFVQLSSQETAKIVGINENFIMRPIVCVVLDPDGREKETPVRINLRERPTLYIKKAVVDKFLSDKFIFVF